MSKGAQNKGDKHGKGLYEPRRKVLKIKEISKAKAFISHLAGK